MSAVVPDAGGALPEDHTTDPLLSARGVTVRYGDTVAIADVDLDVPKGQITALVGPSGCGKTSLLNCFNRMTDLVPGCRVDGKLKFSGESLYGPAVDRIALRRRVGMIFQQPNPFPLSIRRNLEIPLREHGVRERHERHRRMERALRDVGLWEELGACLEAPAQALSGGQQQRLCLARALALSPEVLLLDEPCSALDPLSSGAVEDLIASMRGRVTQVLVTHNLAQARRLADRVAVLWLRAGCGRLIEQGPAAAVLRHPQSELTRAYLAGERG